MWAWYDALRAISGGRAQLPENGQAQRQLLNDGEIDMLVSFNPAEAAVYSANRLLPRQRARVQVFDRGRSATRASSPFRTTRQ